MKKADFIQAIPTLASAANEARMIPFTAGDVLHFTLATENIAQRNAVIGGANRAWDEFITDEGDAVSITQLTRRRNGLTLEGRTIQERFESFCNLFDEEGHLALRIVAVVNRTGVDENGTAIMSRYLRFEVL